MQNGKPHNDPLPGETINKSSADGVVSTAPVKREYISVNERRRRARRKLNELHQQDLNKQTVKTEL